MAFDQNEKMATCKNWCDYFLLNDGLDEEDNLTENHQSDSQSFVNQPCSDILPSESASQTLAGIIPTLSSPLTFLYPPQKYQHLAPVTT
jgi:hypothetical protein